MKVRFRHTALHLAIAASCAVLASLFVACTAIEPGPSDERRTDISFRDQEYLAQYGDWIQATPYGEVWSPRVAASWEPFYYGEWVWSDQGWLWESYEPYGWLVYHHGNWEFRPETGWFWVPSEQWSPAAVQWTEFGDYVGWAPSPPGGVILPAPWSPEGTHYWTVVENHDFAQDNVGKYKVVKNIPSVSVGAEINNRQQPDVAIISKVTKRSFSAIKVQRQATPVGSHTYYKMVLPPPDAKRVKTETALVEKNVLVKKETKPVPSAATEKATKKKSAKDSAADNSDKDKPSDSKKGSDQDAEKKQTR